MVAHLIADAAVLGSNLTSPTMTLKRCRVFAQYCLYCKYSIKARRSYLTVLEVWWIQIQCIAFGTGSRVLKTILRILRK